MSSLPHLDGSRFRIDRGDCLRMMRMYPDDCFDSIVTDPPYGLSFMGADWDSFGGRNGRQSVSERQDEARRYADENRGAPRYGNSHGKKVTRNEMVAFQEAMTPIFEEALRVAKPGAHLLCFGGTRTFHRMACAIEDAGWEVRDTIMYVYGSGFPKSMDVGKAIDKALGAERQKYVNPTPHAPAIATNSCGDYKGDVVTQPVPVTDQAKEWDGWGTCLKPAWEPIIVARKPLDGTVAHNVMTYGTGAINIDGCRVPTEEFIMTNGVSKEVQDRQSIYGSYGEKKTGQTAGQKLGRFPANLVHDGSEEVTSLFPVSKSSDRTVPRKRRPQTTCYGTYDGGGDYYDIGRGDSGSAARFFYCAKASKRDRGEGNHHPTVKPTALMQWLVRLVTPKGGVVLDPFAGSGSTGVAAMREGMDFVGMEMDDSYADIMEHRIGDELS